MTEIVTGALKCLLGFLLDTIRDEVSERLQNGDATDEECRRLFVRELDDINRKLDGQAKKDLLASVLFLKEGVEALYQSLHQAYSEKNGAAESSEQASFEGAVSSRDADGSAINEAITLVNAIASLKLRSNERLKSATESFKLAREKATEAFANETLSIEERIQASQVRMMARILECLEDPIAGVKHCLRYLKELHDLGAIRETFSVLIDGGLKSRLNKTKRVSIASSVQLTNQALDGFARKFTKVPPNRLGWPTILLGTKVYFCPVLGESRHVRKLKDSGLEIEQAWVRPDITFDEEIDLELAAVNSKGNIVAKTRRGNVFKVFKRAGECHTLCEVLWEEFALRLHIAAMDVDVEDNLYVINFLEEKYILPFKAKLLIFDENGNKRSESPLPYSLDTLTPAVCLSINKNKRIAILDRMEEIVYIGKVCVEQNLFEVDTSFKLESWAWFLSFLDLDETKIVTVGFDTLCIHTAKGELEREVRVPTKEHGHIDSFAIDHVTGRIVAKTHSNDLLSFSETGELIECLTLDIGDKLRSHPQGPVALVNCATAYILRT